MLKVANSSEFRNLSPAKFVPMLADRGEYLASESSFYRLLKANRQLAHRRKEKPSRPYTELAPLTATRPNAIWSWDITYLKTRVRGIFYYLYMHIDLFSRRIMGAQVHASESAEHAAKMASQLTKSYGIKPGSLYLHSDNGGAMKGSTMVVTMEKLGVIPSFSRPGVSDDNPFSESLFKTMKYHPSFPERPFDSIFDAQDWVDRFVYWYNNHHLHSGIRFVTPQSRYDGLDVEILDKRREVYEKARESNPQRWRNNIRDWEPIQIVTLLARKQIWQCAS